MDGEEIKAVPILVPALLGGCRGFHPSGNHLRSIAEETGLFHLQRNFGAEFELCKQLANLQELHYGAQ
jgi:hypothetical protein